MYSFLPLLTLIIVSCNSTTPPDFSKRIGARELAVKGQSPIEAEFLWSQSSDSYSETTGVLSVNFRYRPSVGENLGDYTLRSNRLAVLPSRVAISQGQRQALRGICRDIAIIDDSGNAKDEMVVANGREIKIAWRSHYDVEDREQLIGLSLETGVVPSCLLQLTIVAQNGQSSSFDIVFSPGNSEKRFVVSSQNHEQAIDESLLLINQEKTGYVIDTQSGLTVDVKQTADLPLGVKALTQKNVDISQAWAQDCRTVSTESLEAAEPDKEVSLTYLVESDLSFAISEVLATSSSGRILPQCENIESNISGSQISFKTTCGNLLQVVNLAADEMCAYTAYLRNTNDSENTLGKRFRIERYSVEAGENDGLDIAVSNPIEAYGIIPKNKNNPISNSLVVMDGFNEQQVAAAEVSFDLWLAHSKSTYDRFFANKIKQINYMDTGRGCGFFSGAAAYAYLGDDRFYWCRAGYMSARAVDPNQDAPAGAVYRALLMLHEVLHANNYSHDFDRNNYASCDEGTSLSATIPVEIVKCSKSYCQQFKDFAIRDYIDELNYSVTDERRFQGTCANWNSALGLTRQSF